MITNLLLFIILLILIFIALMVFIMGVRFEALKWFKKNVDD